MCNKIIAQCSDRLQLYQSSKKHGMVFYNPVLDRNDIPLLMEKTDGKIGPDDEGISLLKAAHILKDICNAVKKTSTPLPKVLTSKHFREGASPIPEKCLMFFHYSDLKSLYEGLQGTLNPFDKDLDKEQLYCLTSGVALNEHITQELVKFYQIGDK